MSPECAGGLGGRDTGGPHLAPPGDRPHLALPGGGGAAWRPTSGRLKAACRLRQVDNRRLPAQPPTSRSWLVGLSGGAPCECQPLRCLAAAVRSARVFSAAASLSARAARAPYNYNRRNATHLMPSTRHVAPLAFHGASALSWRRPWTARWTWNTACLALLARATRAFPTGAGSCDSLGARHAAVLRPRGGS